MQDVVDEYRQPLLLFAVRPAALSGAAAAGAEPAELRRQRLNQSMSAALLTQLADVFSVVAAPHPGALPLLSWQPGNVFHESAICAAALDAATMPYRLLRADGGSSAALGARQRGGRVCRAAALVLHRPSRPGPVCTVLLQDVPACTTWPAC